MYQVFTILFLLFSLQSYSADLKIEEGNLEQVKLKDKYPLKLILASDSTTLYTMGDKNYNTKTLVYANRRLRNIKTSNLKTNQNERADNFIWTGENVIVLWENKKGKDREFYYQTILKNGRITTKVKLDVLKDDFGPYLREYQVKTLSSPDNIYFAFIIKGIVSKSFYGKNAVYDELIAVFDQNGKLLDKQKTQFQQAKDFEKFYFLTDSSDVLKISSQQAKDKISVERKNILNKEKEVYSISFDRPDSIFIKQYRIDYNPTTHNYNYFARIKSADSIIGQNGVFVANFDLDSRQQIQSSIYIFDSLFVEDFKKNPAYSNGNILYKDHSLNGQYVTKKVLTKQDGGFYYVQEHFSQESFLIKNDKEQREKPDELKSFFNVDNLPNVPLHCY
ncbi:MAG: hypothetical protein M9887_05160 [Chitinophagales bacterium]|nr:hypothetical protein [Chitinophagales bacterium]